MLLNLENRKITYARWRRRVAPVIDLLYLSRNSLLKRWLPKAVLAFWYREKNFGDMLTPDLLRHFGVKPLFTPNLDHCEVISVGSILEIIPESYQGVILGSGFINTVTERQFKQASILLVRGHLTAEKLALPASGPMGDPGILVDQVYRKALEGVTKKYALGIVPHYKHVNEIAIQKIINRYPEDVRLIDVRRKPPTVIRDIAACQHVASSSLHGIVVSHSLGIPTYPLEFDTHLRGGRFKFFDYFSVYKIKPTFHKLRGNESLEQLCEFATSIEPQIVAGVKDTVNAAFIQYKTMLNV